MADGTRVARLTLTGRDVREGDRLLYSHARHPYAETTQPLTFAGDCPNADARWFGHGRHELDELVWDATEYEVERPIGDSR